MNDAADNVVAEMIHVHPERVCRDDPTPCCLHSPSRHHMVDWRMNWRGDEGMMERICEHGVGHPDPDHVAYMERKNPGGLDGYAHGCDGCCKSPEELERAFERDPVPDPPEMTLEELGDSSPWDYEGITETAYWKKRYLEQRLTLGYVAGQLMGLQAFITNEDKPPSLLETLNEEMKKHLEEG